MSISKQIVNELSTETFFAKFQDGDTIEVNIYTQNCVKILNNIEMRVGKQKTIYHLTALYCKLNKWMPTNQLYYIGIPNQAVQGYMGFALSLDSNALILKDNEGL